MQSQAHYRIFRRLVYFLLLTICVFIVSNIVFIIRSNINARYQFEESCKRFYVRVNRSYSVEEDDLLRKRSGKRKFSQDGEFLSINGCCFDLKTGLPSESSDEENFPDTYPPELLKSMNLKPYDRKGAFTPNNKYLAIDKHKDRLGGRSQWISIIDTTTNVEVEKTRHTHSTFGALGMVFYDSIAIDNDLKYLIWVSYSLNLYDIRKDKIIVQRSPGLISYGGVEFSPKGNTFLATIIDYSDNKSLRRRCPQIAARTTAIPVAVQLWEVENDSLLLTIYVNPKNQDWAVLTPDGKYDGSEDMLKHLLIKCDGTELKESNFKKIDELPKENHVPGLLATIFNQERLPDCAEKSP